MKHEITPEDILPLEEFARIRKEERARVGALKKNRRIEVGPHATFYFESYDTMWLQVQEMLHIEKGGDAQLKDELAAYNPLIPNGSELVATVMFEIDDRERRQRILGKLGGVERTIKLRVGGETITGVAEEDQDRTTAEGKASSVQFIHFPFNPHQREMFKRPGTEVVVGIHHENYSHMAIMPESVRAALARDFD